MNEKQIVLEKTEAIINSCRTHDHFNASIKYVELFHKKFNDLDAYERLHDLFKTERKKYLLF
jgi:hypothetical protein